MGRVFESYRGNNITLSPPKFTSKLSGDLSLFYSKAVAMLWFGTIFYPRTSPAHNYPTSGVYHARDVICSQSNETVRGTGSENANPTMLTPWPRLLAFRPTFLGSWLVTTHIRIQTVVSVVAGFIPPPLDSGFRFEELLRPCKFVTLLQYISLPCS